MEEKAFLQTFSEFPVFLTLNLKKQIVQSKLG